MGQGGLAIRTLRNQSGTNGSRTLGSILAGGSSGSGAGSVRRMYSWYVKNNSQNSQNSQNKNDVKTMQPISRAGGGPSVNNSIIHQQPMLATNIALNNPQLHQQNNNGSPEINFNNAFSGPNINNLLQIEEPMPANEFLSSRF